MNMFFHRIKGKEYNELLTMIENLRVKFEGLKLEFELTRQKLRASKRLKEEESSKEEENHDPYKGVLLPE